MANGTTSKIYDAVKTNIELGQSSLQAVLHVMPGAIDDVILGLDTLGSMGAAFYIMTSEMVDNATRTTPNSRLRKPSRTKRNKTRKLKCRRINRVEPRSTTNQRNEAARIRDFLAEEL